MTGIFKAFAAALVLLTTAWTSAHAQDTADTNSARRIINLTYTDLSAVESKALKAWPQLAKRDGNRLIVMNHGGGVFTDRAAVFIDGQGRCMNYTFIGVQTLFDGYLRRLEPVAELTCLTAEGPLRALVQNDGSLLTSAGGLTASADGHYVFIERTHQRSEDDQGKPIDLGMVASIRTWTAAGGDGPYTFSCTDSKADGASDFRAICTGPGGRSFNARFASARPNQPDNSYKSWKVYNLDNSADSRDYRSTYMMIVFSNGGDPFVSATTEAKAIAEHPGLVRRDGPDLVVLDEGREARRMRDVPACVYWYYGKSLDLYDARKGAKAPVAVVYCQYGEFGMHLLAPAYADDLRAGQNYIASDDGRTVMVGYGSTDIVDWQSRKVLLNYRHRCGSLSARGNDHFSGTCEADDRSEARRTVDFDRDANGVWKATERLAAK